MYTKLAGATFFIAVAVYSHCWYFPKVHWLLNSGVGSGANRGDDGEGFGGPYCILYGMDDSVSFQPEKERLRYEISWRRERANVYGFQSSKTI